jgi:hypothetical protein
MFTLPKGDDLLATTAVWGRNDHDDSGTDSYLMEASYTIARRHTYFARLEHVTKRGEELAAVPADDNFAISSATLGYVHDVHLRSIDIGFGAGISAYRFPETLETVYGDDPRSYVLFVRIRPSQMKME